jgi:hypothetical protein
LKTRFKEHIRNIRFNKDESACAQHILNQEHQYGPIEQIMEIIEQARKGNLMNIKESYYIVGMLPRLSVCLYTAPPLRSTRHDTGTAGAGG